MADQFKRGLFGEVLRNVYSPLYPVFVGAIHFVIPNLEFAGRLVSLVSGVLLIYLCFLFGRRLFRDNTRALWVAFLAAFQPYLVRYSGQVLSESLSTLLFALAVFSFYVGWQEKRRTVIAVSGFCLLLAYLTRPEYLVFFAPLLLFLALKRRAADIVVFLLPLGIVGCLYMLYLHAQTGLWIVSNKATLSPIIPFSAFFPTFPLVAYYFGSAIFPLFLLFAILGIGKVEKGYRNLVIVLVVFHVLSLSFVGHSTKRYSVEFVPLCMFFAVEGIRLVLDFLKRYAPTRLTSALIALAVVFAGVSQSYTPFRHDRALQKEAGLFLATYDQGSVVASRLPIVAFYARSASVNLEWEMAEDRTIDRLRELVSEKQVKYIAVDEQTENEYHSIKEYVGPLRPLREFRKGNLFVRIYRTG